MKPFDPRLAQVASAARGYLATTVGAGLVSTALVLAQAVLLAHAIVHAGSGVAALRGTLVALAAVLLARAVLDYLGEWAALRAAAAVKSELRRAVAARVVALGPGWLRRRSTGELTTLLTRGLDALDGYFARYLPQLVLAALVPCAVLVTVARADVISAVVIGVTLPLVPLFMVLIGLHTRARTERQWTLLSRLGGHFLDVVEGLPTLKVFGRARAQAATVRRVTDEHRRATMATLRVAFLSALALELLATLATALVAVEVGLRLLAGTLGYETALLVLLLAPEAYLPLRNVGAQFHASMEGVVAAGLALDVLDLPVPEQRSGGVRVDLGRDEIRFDGVGLTYPDRARPALDGVDLVIRPGEELAVVGESGAGKSSILALLLGFERPTSGSLTVGGAPIETVDIACLREQIAWVPQRAHLFAGSIADNIRLARPDAPDDDVRRAAEAAGVAAFATEWPAGLDTTVGERGLLLSSGQRQRVAVARALLRDAPLVLLDEPTAHLDEESARDLQRGLRALTDGRTVVVVSHTHGWTGAAERVLRLGGGRLATPATAVLAS